MRIKEGSQTNNQIRRYRRKHRLSLKKTARLIGLKNECHVSQWETGRKVPSLDNALKLSAALKCPVEILFLERFNQIRSEIHERRLAMK